MKKPLHRWKPFAEVFKSSGGHVIAPLASHDAEEGRNACTLLALFASLFQLVLMAGNSINKITLFLCCMIIIGVETLADGKQGIKIIHRFIRHGCDLQFDFVICDNNPSCSQDK